MGEENQKNLSRPLAFIEQMLYPILEQKFYPCRITKGSGRKDPFIGLLEWYALPENRKGGDGMETIYCDLEVKKVRTGALASGGGTAGDGVAYAIVPRRRPLPKRAGKVLDFEACRWKLERSAAGREETTAECPACPEDGAAQRAVGATWARRLELWATAAVLLFALAATARFLVW